MKRISLCLILLFLFPPGQVTPAVTTTTTTASIFSSLVRDPLVDWLDHLKVHVPDQSFSAGLITVKIKGLCCTHFSIQSIESEYMQQQTMSDEECTPQLNLKVFQVAACCEGEYESTGGVSGSITANLTGNKALEWTVRVLDASSSGKNGTSVRQPDSVQTTTCDTAVEVNDLKFSGSLSAKLLQLFRDKIARAVTSAVKAQSCSAIETQVDPLVTGYLRNVMEWLQPYLNETTTAAAVVGSTTNLELKEETLHGANDESSRIHFENDLPVLVSTLDWVNDFVEEHLDVGFLPAFDNATDSFLKAYSSDCGGFGHGVNGILKHALPVAWTLPMKQQHFHFLLPKYAAIDLHLHSIAISGDGLHSWKRLTVLKPTDDDSFGTILDTPSNVSLTGHVSVDVTSVPGGMFHGDPLHESFFVEVNATSLSAAIDFAVNIDKERFQQVTAGTVVNVLQGMLPGLLGEMSPEVACLLEPVRSIQASGLSAFVQLSEVSLLPDLSISDPQSVQKLEHDLDVLLDNILQLFLTEYAPLVTEAIVGLTNGPVQDRFNHFLAKAIETPNATNCTASSFDDDLPHLVNFTKIKPLHRLNSFLNQSSTLFKINEYFDCTANVINRLVQKKLLTPTLSPQAINEFLFSPSLRALIPATVSSQSSHLALSLRDFEIKHAGSLQHLEVFSPEGDGMHLKSGFVFGSNATDSMLLRPHVSVSIDFVHAPLDLSASSNMTLYLDGVSWSGISVLHYDSNEFQRMTLMQLLSQGQCALVPAFEFDLVDFANNLAFFETVLNVSVTSSAFGSNETRVISIDSKDYQDVEDKAYAVFHWFTNSAQDTVSVLSKAALSRADDMCEGILPPDSHDNSERQDENANDNTVLLILSALFIFAQPAILMMKRSQEHGQAEDADGRQDDLSEPLLHPRYTSIDESLARDFCPPAKPNSLMFDAHIPELARHLIPVLVITIIALLLSSNLSIGASVDLIVSMGDRSFRAPSLFEFSLLNTAKYMLDAGIYFLFFLVVGFSGIWPYAKLILMLVAWVTPRSSLTNERREELLLKLDALSKFSLVDTYFLVVMLVAFRYHLDISGESAIDVYVTPLFGFYGFLAATGASLVVGHVMVFFHRCSELLLEGDMTETEPDAILSHAFKMADGSKRQLSRSFRMVLLTVLVVVILLLAVGIAQKSFAFEFGGLAGLALGDERRTSYSLLSLGAAIPESVENQQFGVRALQVAFYFYAVVTPFTALSVLFLVLVCPLTLRRQLQLLTLAEIANAWSAIEVFVLSIIAALLEISTFASFLIGHRCDLIDDILQDYSNGEDSMCFTVHATVTWDAAFLVLGVVLNSFWVSMVLRLSHLAMRERVRELKADGEGAGVYGLSSIEEAENKSLIQWIATSRFSSFVLASDDEDGERANEAGPPVISEELISTPWQEEDSFSEEWKQAAERDPAWKEWKEATSVT